MTKYLGGEMTTVYVSDKDYKKLLSQREYVTWYRNNA